MSFQIDDYEDIKIEFVDEWPEDNQQHISSEQHVEAKADPNPSHTHIDFDVNSEPERSNFFESHTLDSTASDSEISESKRSGAVDLENDSRPDFIDLTCEIDVKEDDDLNIVASSSDSSLNLNQILTVQAMQVSDNGITKYKLVFPQTIAWMEVPSLRNSVFPLHFVGTDRLKLHQLEGVKFLYDNLCFSSSVSRSGNFDISAGRGCILADVMGLGKTLTTVAALHMFATKWHSSDLKSANTEAVAPEGWHPLFPRI